MVYHNGQTVICTATACLTGHVTPKYGVDGVKVARLSRSDCADEQDVHVVDVQGVYGRILVHLAHQSLEK